MYTSLVYLIYPTSAETDEAKHSNVLDNLDSHGKDMMEFCSFKQKESMTF